MPVPTLTSSITFDKIRVYVSFARSQITSIIARNGSDEVAIIPSVLNNGKTYDPNSEAFIAARDALHSGSAVLEYYISGAITSSIISLDSDLPEHVQSVRDFDPMRAAYLALAIAPANVGPDNLILYKYIVVAQDDDQPTAPDEPTEAFGGDVSALTEHYETLGWYLHTHDAQTNAPDGDPDLYYIIVNYFWVGETGVGTLSIADPITGGVQFSTDHGVTWTFEPPNNEDRITDISITIGNEVVDIVINPETDLITPIEVLMGSSYPSNIDSAYPITSNLDTSHLDELYAVQIRVHKMVNVEDNLPVYGDETHIIAIDEIFPIYPSQIGWDLIDSQFDSVVPFLEVSNEQEINFYSLAVHRNSGRVVYGISENTNLQSSYGSGSWVSWLIAWEFYPKTILAATVSISGTNIILIGTARGMSVGDIIFVGPEHMRITEISESLVTQYNLQDVVTTSISVDRGVNGTTHEIAQHAIGRAVRAVINEDKLRMFVLLATNGYNATPFRYRILGFRKYEVDV